MSLLARVDPLQFADGSDGGSSADFRRIRAAIRDRLHEEMDPRIVARLVVGDPALARLELVTRLDSLLFGVDGPRADRDVLERVKESLLDDIIGLGPIESLMADPTVDEVMINGPDRIYVERSGALQLSDRSFDDVESLRVAIERIIGPVGRRVDERTPYVSARLPDGSRVNVVVPPVAIGGPFVTIRKFAENTPSLSHLVGKGSLSPGIAQLLSWAVRCRRNIAVSGGTGSGKTTLLNALSLEIPGTDRIITIEDAAELRFDSHPHVLSLEARPPSVEGNAEVTIRDLLVNSLRMRPDRIVVGECRAGEALEMLQAMNTGHDGSLTTLHANSPGDVFTRLAAMVGYVANLPLDAIERQIASALDLIVHLERGSDGSRVVASIVGVESGDEPLRPILDVDRPQWFTHPGVPRWVLVERPPWFDEVVARGVGTAEEVAEWTP